MSVNRKKLNFLWNDEIKKIVRYTWKPIYLTVIYGIILLLLILGIITISGNFEEFIVSTDLKYNSPMLSWMLLVFGLTVVFTLIYGISLCLYKYKRPGKKVKNGRYVEGNSYRALNHTFDNNKEKEVQ